MPTPIAPGQDSLATSRPDSAGEGSPARSSGRRAQRTVLAPRMAPNCHPPAPHRRGHSLAATHAPRVAAGRHRLPGTQGPALPTPHPAPRSAKLQSSKADSARSRDTCSLNTHSPGADTHRKHRAHRAHRAAPPGPVPQARPEACRCHQPLRPRQPRSEGNARVTARASAAPRRPTWRRLSVHRGRRRRRELRPRVHLGRRCLHEVTPAAVLAVAPRWGFRSCGWPRALALRAVAARPGAGGPRPADAAVGLTTAVTRARLGLGVGRRLLPRQTVLVGLQQRGTRRQQRLHLSGHLRGGAGRAAGPARGRWRGAGARAARTRGGADGRTLSGAPGGELRRA